LRNGVTGVALAWWGFRASRTLVGERDLFGRAFKMTSVNVADSVAAAAVLAMGEGAEARPLALVRYDEAEFTDADPDPAEARMEPARDLYLPAFRRGLR
jgi:F420-0:gamma-glutamyl ligase